MMVDPSDQDVKFTEPFRWSDKRLSLYQMGQLIDSFAKAVISDPNMPDNPYPMTLNELNRHVIDELGKMNERGEW